MSGLGADRAQLVTSAGVAFLASFCTLAIELVAGRMLAPFVGVSLYTWTSIIGVVLAALGLGALAGGWLADRYPRNAALAWLLMASGLTAIAIVPLARWLGPLPISDNFMLRISLLAGAVFFIPCFLLGTITPVAIRLAVRRVDGTGGVVGTISSISTLGAILGTFATGFFLISRFGTRSILLGIALLLLACGVVLGWLSHASVRRLRRTGLAVILFSVVALGGVARASPWFELGNRDAYYVKESNYFTIQLEEKTRTNGVGKLQVLRLDHLIHSYTDLEDPSFLAYGYLKGLADVVTTQVAAENRTSLRYLFLGGGGYTFPRYLEHRYASAQIEVVEIDPAVSRAAFKYLGVDHDTSIKTVNQDARWFVHNFAGQPYDLIFLDVFNDLAVPYHLTTLEFFKRLRELLSPRGVLIVHALDRFDSGRFLPALAYTIRQAYGTGDTALWAHRTAGLTDQRDSFLVMAGRGGQVVESLASRLRACEPCGTRGSVLDHERLGEYLAARNPILLSDDFAPVDTLVLSLFGSN
jgi:predicted membrane-bound spermidine synthase